MSLVDPGRPGQTQKMPRSNHAKPARPQSRKRPREQAAGDFRGDMQGDLERFRYRGSAWLSLVCGGDEREGQNPPGATSEAETTIAYPNRPVEAAEYDQNPPEEEPGSDMEDLR